MRSTGRGVSVASVTTLLQPGCEPPLTSVCLAGPPALEQTTWSPSSSGRTGRLSRCGRGERRPGPGLSAGRALQPGLTSSARRARARGAVPACAGSGAGSACGHAAPHCERSAACAPDVHKELACGAVLSGACAAAAGGDCTAKRTGAALRHGRPGDRLPAYGAGGCGGRREEAQARGALRHRVRRAGRDGHDGRGCVAAAGRSSLRHPPLYSSGQTKLSEAAHCGHGTSHVLRPQRCPPRSMRARSRAPHGPANACGDLAHAQPGTRAARARGRPAGGAHGGRGGGRPAAGRGAPVRRGPALHGRVPGLLRGLRAHVRGVAGRLVVQRAVRRRGQRRARDCRPRPPAAAGRRRAGPRRCAGRAGAAVRAGVVCWCPGDVRAAVLAGAPGSAVARRQQPSGPRSEARAGDACAACGAVCGTGPCKAGAAQAAWVSLPQCDTHLPQRCLPPTGLDPTDPRNMPRLWHKGEDFVKGGTPVPLLFRMATVADVKPPKGTKMSRFLWKAAPSRKARVLCPVRAVPVLTQCRAHGRRAGNLPDACSVFDRRRRCRRSGCGSGRRTSTWRRRRCAHRLPDAGGVCQSSQSGIPWPMLSCFHQLQPRA